MAVKAIRGATTVGADREEEIYSATRELIGEIMRINGLSPEEIISVIFTVTPDIKSAFPAAAARAIGFTSVPLLCTQEIPVAGALPLCVRVLMHVETDKKQSEIRHRFLREAAQLRPDLGQ